MCNLLGPLWGINSGNCTCYIMHSVGSSVIPGRPKLTSSQTGCLVTSKKEKYLPLAPRKTTEEDVKKDKNKPITDTAPHFYFYKQKPTYISTKLYKTESFELQDFEALIHYFTGEERDPGKLKNLLKITLPIIRRTQTTFPDAYFGILLNYISSSQ